MAEAVCVTSSAWQPVFLSIADVRVGRWGKNVVHKEKHITSVRAAVFRSVVFVGVFSAGFHTSLAPVVERWNSLLLGGQG